MDFFFLEKAAFKMGDGGGERADVEEDRGKNKQTKKKKGTVVPRFPCSPTRSWT